MERQAPFLKSLLREADHHERQELLRMASADQNNAISEFVINTIAIELVVDFHIEVPVKKMLLCQTLPLCRVVVYFPYRQEFQT